MTLIAEYNAAISRAEIQNDPLQRDVILHLQRVMNELAVSSNRSSWFKWIRRQPVCGLYLYGPVGIGKTYLVDLFYQHIDERYKSRFHFHEFMQQVDAELRRLQGQKDPIKTIAARIAKTTRLLCFDEFLVNDVACAMILGDLLQAILAKGVVLVATSNTAPDDLYLNGVQRDRFLPAIALIKEHCQVLALADKCDYRLGRELSHKAYLYPLDKTAEQVLAKQFSELAGHISLDNEIDVQQRMIPCVKYGDKAIWFLFDTICNLPRSQLDYLELASRFDTVFVSDIPTLSSKEIGRVILLIHFTDVMYDRGIRLIVSAEVPVDELYVGGELAKKFKRTLSRLKEMQSEDYLSRHHRRQIQSL